MGSHCEGLSQNDPTDDHHRGVSNRLKTARGHIDGIIRMVDEGAWCPDVMKQLAAVQGVLESTTREVLRHHLTTHVAEALRGEDGDVVVDELLETLKFDRRALRP